MYPYCYFILKIKCELINEVQLNYICTCIYLIKCEGIDFQKALFNKKFLTGEQNGKFNKHVSAERDFIAIRTG